MNKFGKNNIRKCHKCEQDIGSEGFYMSLIKRPITNKEFSASFFLCNMCVLELNIFLKEYEGLTANIVTEDHKS